MAKKKGKGMELPEKDGEKKEEKKVWTIDFPDGQNRHAIYCPVNKTMYKTKDFPLKTEDEKVMEFFKKKGMKIV